MLQKAKATKIILCKFITTTQQLHFTKLFTRKYVQLGMPVPCAFLDFQAGYSEATLYCTDNIPVKFSFFGKATKICTILIVLTITM